MPDAPQITQVISASGAVDVAFSFGGNGGSPITNIAYSVDNGTTWTTRSPASTAGPLALTGLTNGTTYPVRIRAINNLGPGAESAAVNALPATTPGAPAVTSVTSGNGNLTVSFTAPASTGGAPVINYQYSLDGGDNWSDSAATASPMEINNVTVGTAYDVAIRAVNLRGPGTASNAATKRATAPPAPPTITSVQEGNGEIVLRYAPPSDTGGDALQDYFYSVDGGTTWASTAGAQSLANLRGGVYSSREYASIASVGPMVASTPTSLRLTNLVNGQSYAIALRASNVDALGVPSGTVQGIPSTVPSVPRNVAVSAGDATMSIAWDAPASAGGLTITRYEYSIDGGTVWNDVAENPMMLRGLRNGTTYSVKVRAFNANGASVATTAVTAKPVRTPLATAAPVAAVGTTAGAVSLSWQAPAEDGGSQVSDYVIELSADAGNTWQTVSDGVSTATTVLVSNLVVGRAYLFRVTPVNSVGTGEASIASNTVTAAGVAEAPAVAPAPVVTPIATPVTAPATQPVTKPVKSAPKKSTKTPSKTPSGLPDVTKPMDNTGSAAVSDGASTVFDMPESGWVRESLVGRDFTVTTSEKLTVRIKVDATARVNVRGMPVFRPGDEVSVSVTGLMPATETSMWVFSTPVLLGRGTTDASGALDASWPLPSALAVGDHTVQLNGISADGTARSVEIKIEIVRPDDENTTDNEQVTPAPGSNDGSLPTGIILIAALAGLILAAGVVIGHRRRSVPKD